MAVVLLMTAEEGSRLWHSLQVKGGECAFQEGSGSKPEPYSVEGQILSVRDIGI